MSALELVIKTFIREELSEWVPAAVSQEMSRIRPSSPWMTEKELAEYWRLFNKEGELTTESIRKWTARPAGEHPLPCGSVGEMRRYHRDEVDQWAREEAVLQREKREAKRAESDGSGKKKQTSHLKAVESRAAK